MDFLHITITTVWPIAFAVGAGWALARWKGVPSRPLADAGVILIGPALLLANIPVDLGRQGKLAILLLGASAALLVLAEIAVRLLPLDNADDRTSIRLGISMSNFGFYGLPLVEYSLGADAIPISLTILALLNIPTGIISIYLASPSPSFKLAVRDTLKSPFSWAVLATLFLGLLAVRLPAPLEKPLALLGSATVPVMLIVLGIEIAALRIRTIAWGPVLVATALKLLAPAPIVWLLARALGLDTASLMVKSAILQLSTPSGVTPFLFMTAFGRRSSLLAETILVTLLVSLVTLPLLIGFLR